MHRSDVKFMCRLPGGMLAYETIDSVDMVVTHDSYLSLKHSLARHGMHILFIHQADAVIEDQESYYGTLRSSGSSPKGGCLFCTGGLT
jgi:hypothetical protein